LQTSPLVKQKDIGSIEELTPSIGSRDGRIHSPQVSVFSHQHFQDRQN
jgi:hypothetical protein